MAKKDETAEAEAKVEEAVAKDPEKVSLRPKVEAQAVVEHRAKLAKMDETRGF
jgi:hypothetical protein